MPSFCQSCPEVEARLPGSPTDEGLGVGLARAVAVALGVAVAPVTAAPASVIL